MPYYTNLALVFRALDGAQRAFEWILTDVDCIALDGEPLPIELCGGAADPIQYSGSAITELVTRRRIQFVWAVLSGFSRDDVPDRQTLDPYPFADGNAALWQPGVSIQHPRAQLEIVCWDSGATLLLSRQDELSKSFRSFFPDAVDLDDYNAEHARREP